MEIVAGTNPFNLFQSWFDEAVAAEINDLTHRVGFGE